MKTANGSNRSDVPTATQTPHDIAFCSYTILDDDVFVVPESRVDPRFDATPLVTGKPNIRSYAGGAIAFFREDQRETMKSAVRRAIDDGKGWDLEAPLITDNGRSIRVRIVGSVERVALAVADNRLYERREQRPMPLQ